MKLLNKNRCDQSKLIDCTYYAHLTGCIKPILTCKISTEAFITLHRREEGLPWDNCITRALEGYIKALHCQVCDRGNGQSVTFGVILKHTIVCLIGCLELNEEGDFMLVIRATNE